MLQTLYRKGSRGLINTYHGNRFSSLIDNKANKISII